MIRLLGVNYSLGMGESLNNFRIDLIYSLRLAAEVYRGWFSMGRRVCKL